MPTSTARNYFEDFTGEDAVAKFQAMPTANPKVFENDWLDFKEGIAAENHDALDKLWSKALGAFANNEGGVVVFGLRAKEDKTTKIDAVDSVEPVKNVSKLVSKLTELSRFSTDPPLSGIEYKALPLHPDTVEGFVVCYIPEGANKPYRSERFEKRFLMRMGDSAKDLSVSILRQMFYPRMSSRITLNIRAVSRHPYFSVQGLQGLGGGELPLLPFDLSFYIVNSGSSTIEHASIAFTSEGCDIAFEEPEQLMIGATKRLEPYLHPGQRTPAKKVAVLKATTLGDEGSVTFLLYQRNAEPLKFTFGVTFRLGDIVHEGKECKKVEIELYSDT